MTGSATQEGQEVKVTFMLRKSANEAEVRQEIKQNLTEIPEGWEISRIEMGDTEYPSLEAFHAGS